MIRHRLVNARAAWTAFQATEPLGRRLRRWFDYLVLVLALVWCWDALSSRSAHQQLWRAIDDNAQTTTAVKQTTAVLRTRMATVEGRLGLARSTTAHAPLWPGAEAPAVTAPRLAFAPPLAVDEARPNH